MNRIVFLIDGFNVYHSLENASKDLGGKSTKWLDIKSLCSSYLGNIGSNAILKDIYYFSAYATHLSPNNPGVVQRHRNYIKCLEDSGIHCEMNRFKEKIIKCPNCKQPFSRHEEKETDVSISVKIIELFHNDECDTVVIVSGDTDISPAARTAKLLFPAKHVWFLFPYKRSNEDLRKLNPGQNIKIRKESYTKHQFPNPHKLSDGTTISKPATW